MTLRRTESRRGVGGIPVISKDRRLKLRAMGSTQAEERREIHWFLCSVSLNRWIAYDGSSLERKKMKRESQMNYGPFSEGEGESEGEIGRGGESEIRTCCLSHLAQSHSEGADVG